MSSSQRIHFCSRILLSLLALSGTSIGWPSTAAAVDQTTLAISIRTLSSPYQVMYKVGAEAYAKAVDLPLDVLTTEANSQKGLTQG
jgi:ABC-type sugar transport system substrate-binding protein